MRNWLKQFYIPNAENIEHPEYSILGNNICDKNGCGIGTDFQIDSTKPITVTTQLIIDGIDTGKVVEVKQFFTSRNNVHLLRPSIQARVSYGSDSTSLFTKPRPQSMKSKKCQSNPETQKRSMKMLTYPLQSKAAWCMK